MTPAGEMGDNELRIATSKAFDRLRALYAVQKEQPFGCSLQRQIEGTRQHIARLTFEQGIRRVRAWGAST